MTPSYLPSVKAAEDCLEYLLNTPVSLDKTVFKLSGDFTLVKTWLQELDEGQVNWVFFDIICQRK